MQYTATSYAEPLSRVFDDALRPERDLEVTHAGRVPLPGRAGPVPPAARGRRRGAGATGPAIRLVDRIGLAARRLQNGSIHRYLGYSFVALVAVLIVVSL